MFFALLAGMNFATHFLALRGRSLHPYRVDPEIRAFLAVVLGSCLLLALYLWSRDVYLDFPSALRYASFNTISMATTLGLATDDFGAWPFFAGLWLLLLCSFATAAGSTGGGIKMMRAIILYEQFFREILKLLHPTVEAPVRLGEITVPNKNLGRAHLRLRLHGVNGGSEPVADRIGHGCLQRLQRLCGHPQQHRAWPGHGGAGEHLCGVDGFPDLGLHLCHAARPAGAVHRSGGAVAGVLAQVSAHLTSGVCTTFHGACPRPQRLLHVRRGVGGACLQHRLQAGWGGSQG